MSKPAGYAPTAAIRSQIGVKSRAAFSGNSALNAARRGKGAPTVAVRIVKPSFGTAN